MRRIDYFDRYYPQMRAIVKQVDEFHIFYLRGTPKPEWSEINFHQFKMRKAPHKVLGVYLSRQKFYKETEKVKPDIYYVLSDSWQMEYIRYCAEKSGKPFVIRIRGDYRDIENAVKDRFWTRIIRNYLRERSFKRADLMIPVSEKIRETLLSWKLNSKISESIPSGVDFEKFKPSSNQILGFKEEVNPFIIGYAGRLNYDKGADRLIEIAEKMHETTFLIVGRKEVNIELPGNVRYLGRIPHSGMPSFYNTISVLLLPSRTEGVPLVVLEAYATQKPVICSKEVYPPELPLYGILCDSTIKGYIEAIEDVKELEPLDIRSKIKEYSWDYFGQRVAETMRGLKC